MSPTLLDFSTAFYFPSTKRVSVEERGERQTSKILPFQTQLVTTGGNVVKITILFWHIFTMVIISYLSAAVDSQILEAEDFQPNWIFLHNVAKKSRLGSLVCITKWEFMSWLLGPLQLECDPFFGPRVVCKVSTKMGNSSAGSGSILTKNMKRKSEFTVFLLRLFWAQLG